MLIDSACAMCTNCNLMRQAMNCMLPVQVGKQLSHNNDHVLKQLLREVGQEWDTTGGNARESAIHRLQTHIWNYMC
jgi:uncharacterized membrane protein